MAYSPHATAHALSQPAAAGSSRLYVIAALDRSEYSRVVHICCCPSTLAGGSVERGWCRMLHAVHFVVRGDHRVLPCWCMACVDDGYQTPRATKRFTSEVAVQRVHRSVCAGVPVGKRREEPACRLNTPPPPSRSHIFPVSPLSPLSPHCDAHAALCAFQARAGRRTHRSRTLRRAGRSSASIAVALPCPAPGPWPLALALA